MNLTIASRTSPLALWQAQYVRDQLLLHHPQLSINILGMKTQGDQFLDKPLYKIGGKGLFIKELEQALLSGRADLAVHSLKDMPAHLPAGLGLAAICQRDDPQDAWICPQGFTFATLPSGSRVGTSSLRRMVQLKCLRNDLCYEPLRGNIGTRLDQCLKGQWDAIVLALAGLRRLDLMSRVTMIFSSEQMLPAIGQGALAVESRLHDEKIWALLSALDHYPTRVCVEAERAMNYALGGSCQLPVAGLATYQDNTLWLTGKVGDPNRLIILQAQQQGLASQPQALGQQVAQRLIDQGAQQIIDALRHDQ